MASSPIGVGRGGSLLTRAGVCTSGVRYRGAVPTPVRLGAGVCPTTGFPVGPVPVRGSKRCLVLGRLDHAGRRMGTTTGSWERCLFCWTSGGSTTGPWVGAFLWEVGAGWVDYRSLGRCPLVGR
jgi:hypothetical protein